MNRKLQSEEETPGMEYCGRCQGSSWQLGAGAEGKHSQEAGIWMESLGAGRKHYMQRLGASEEHDIDKKEFG